jgi:KaiC/GvpD/RAD55 family RecA-like ATPase
MRVETGIFGLDELLGSGYRANTVNIVLGSAGTGKTIFALQFLLKGIEKGEKGIFISFDMDVGGIVDTAISLGWDEVEDYVRDNRLKIKKFYVEDISYLNNEVITFISEEAEEHVRIVVDSFTPLVAPLNYEMRKDVNWFFSKLREIGTSVLTLEEPFNGDLSEPSISIPMFLGDSIIHLKNIGYGEAFNRTLRVLKHRGSWHAEGVFPYRILPGFGIFVEGTEYVIESRAEISLDEILNQHGVNRNDLSKELFKKLQKLVESRISGVDGVVSDILRKFR